MFTMTGIFGAGRNGTTLLARLLDGSPDLWVHPINVNYLSVINDLAHRGCVRNSTRQNATTRKLRYLHSRVPAMRLISEFSQHIEDLNQHYVPQLIEPMRINDDPLGALRVRESYSARDFFFVFLKNIRSAYDARTSCDPRHYIFKSIETPYIGDYDIVFPEMRFIHIIRHPLSNFSSTKRSLIDHNRYPFWYLGGDLLRTFLEDRWIPHARFIVDACRRGSDKHFVVRYEDLCERPEAVINDICVWLQVTPPPDPALQTVLGGKQMRELPVLPSKKGIPTPHRVVRNMAKEYKYEEVVTNREREFIRMRTYPLARRLDYFVSEQQSTWPERLRLLGRWLMPDYWEIINAQSKLRLLKALAERRYYIYRKLVFPSRMVWRCRSNSRE